MKKYFKLIAGVTLLEIMLVLAVAALVIVMSIRYYQNATNSENTNIIMEEIQNITAAADNLAQGGFGYSGVNTSGLTAVAGASNMKTPYGSTFSYTPTGSATYTISVSQLPTAVCDNVNSKLAANSKFTNRSCSNGTLTYTYDASS